MDVTPQVRVLMECRRLLLDHRFREAVYVHRSLEASVPVSVK